MSKKHHRSRPQDPRHYHKQSFHPPKHELLQQSEAALPNAIIRLRIRVHEIVFEAETAEGKLFDEVLIAVILLSTLVVMLDSVHYFNVRYATELHYIEWALTFIFSIEYLLRLFCIGHRLKYVFSFYGIVDLLSLLPTYIAFFVPGTQFLVTIRVLRIFRVFRVLKIMQYIGEAEALNKALLASKRKIFLFLYFVLINVVILGSAMYVIEGEENGFTSIPRGIYWAIVTMSTVGYGDISPQTVLGQILASFVMLIGYAILAVPTGIISAELGKGDKKIKTSTRSCMGCGRDGHDDDAIYCKFCGDEV